LHQQLAADRQSSLRTSILCQPLGHRPLRAASGKLTKQNA
jgi:hypothetical protein